MYVFVLMCKHKYILCLWPRRQSFQTTPALTLAALERPPRCLTMSVCMCVCVVRRHVLCRLLSVLSTLLICAADTTIPSG